MISNASHITFSPPSHFARRLRRHMRLSTEVIFLIVQNRFDERFASLSFTAISLMEVVARMRRDNGALSSTISGPRENGFQNFVRSSRCHDSPSLEILCSLVNCRHTMPRRICSSEYGPETLPNLFTHHIYFTPCENIGAVRSFSLALFTPIWPAILDSSRCTSMNVPPLDT